MEQSRRGFLKFSAAAAASLAAPHTSLSGLAGEFAQAVPLSPFGYGDVELLEGPMRRQFQTNHAFYAALDEDRLLKPFRQRAGLPAPGDDMGGWYDWDDGFTLKNMHGFCPGHSFGQYPLRLGARLRRHRLQSHAAEDSAAGSRLCGSRLDQVL